LTEALPYVTSTNNSGIVPGWQFVQIFGGQKIVFSLDIFWQKVQNTEKYLF